jgi:hypothetical protein
MSRLNIDRVVSNLQTRMARYAVSLTDYKQITPTLARVVVTTTNAENISRPELREAIAAATGNNAYPIHRSFQRVTSYGLPALVGFVRANREVKPYEESNVSKMRTLAKNMLMDASDDSLWQVITTASGQRMLARQNQDDLSSVLSSVKQTVHRAPRIAQLAGCAAVGDAVSFVDAKDERVKFGFVLASEGPDADGDAVLDVIQMPDTSNDDADATEQMQSQDEAFSSVSVPESMVVAAITPPTRFFAKEVAAPFDPDNLKALKDYYTKIYNNGPNGANFVAMILKNIDNMAAA